MFIAWSDFSELVHSDPTLSIHRIEAKEMWYGKQDECMKIFYGKYYDPLIHVNREDFLNRVGTHEDRLQIFYRKHEERLKIFYLKHEASVNIDYYSILF